MKSLVRVIAVTVAVLVLLVLLFQRRLLFPRPPAPSVAPPVPAGAEVLRLDVGGDEVEAWLLPPLDADGAPVGAAGAGAGAPVLVFTHGNGEIVDHWLPYMGEPRRWGFAVLLVEYPGYGRSGGSPSEESLRRTMLAAHDALAARDDVDVARLVAHGRSLGGAAACLLAAERPVSALILESSFTSVRSMARRMGVPGFLVLDPLDNETALAAYDGPVLVLHGEADRVVPFAEGEALARVAGVSVERMPCGHNDCPRPWPAVRGFLEQNGLLP